MPDELRRLPEIVGDRVKSIVIAIASGKNNDAKFHGFCFRGAVIFILPEAAAGQRAQAHAVARAAQVALQQALWRQRQGWQRTC